MIVSVDKGRVSEIGTHDELMAAGGIYKDLVTLQARRFTLYWNLCTLLSYEMLKYLDVGGRTR